MRLRQLSPRPHAFSQKALLLPSLIIRINYFLCHYRPSRDAFVYRLVCSVRHIRQVICRLVWRRSFAIISRCLSPGHRKPSLWVSSGNYRIFCLPSRSHRRVHILPSPAKYAQMMAPLDGLLRAAISPLAMMLASSYFAERAPFYFHFRAYRTAFTILLLRR